MSDIEAERRSVARNLRLSEGLTHWRHEGRSQDTPIVLVHGATVPSWEFDLLVPPLVVPYPYLVLIDLAWFLVIVVVPIQPVVLAPVFGLT